MNTKANMNATGPTLNEQAVEAWAAIFIDVAKKLAERESMECESSQREEIDSEQ